MEIYNKKEKHLLISRIIRCALSDCRIYQKVIIVYNISIISYVLMLIR